mgnify:FL=1
MFNFFKKKEEPKNLKEILSQFKDLKDQLDDLFKELDTLKSESKFSIQKVGMVRFNPFKEVGGNQSFSLALLDGNNSGIVITSLYSRAENRFYGKTIKNGRSEYSLSREEKEVIEMAQKRNFYKENEKNSKRKFNLKPEQEKYGGDKETARSGGPGAY